MVNKIKGEIRQRIKTVEMGALAYALGIRMCLRRKERVIVLD
jgi:hypothetical protein